LAPVDDLIIKIERPLGLDPPGQVVASVLAKKASVGSKYVVIDLPVGPEMKVKTKEDAEQLADRFVKVGNELGLKVKVILTDGYSPVSNYFGAALEAKEALEILEGKLWNETAEKSCHLAGALLEMADPKIRKGDGYIIARRTIENGRALAKMKEIIKAQGKRIDSSEKIKFGKYSYDFKMKGSGTITRYGIKRLTSLARHLGAPLDKGAGLELFVRGMQRFEKGKTLMRLYSNNLAKLEYVKKLVLEDPGIYGEGIVLEEID
jgi:thymidine phosphorylase